MLQTKKTVRRCCEKARMSSDLRRSAHRAAPPQYYMNTMQQ